MSENKQNEKPEVYALRQENGDWQISRRDFLKAAGIGAAAMGMALNSRMVRPVSADQDLTELCQNAASHEDSITKLCASPDGRYLVTRDYEKQIKCWDFENYSLLGARKADLGSPSMVGMFRDEQCLIYVENKMIYAKKLPGLKDTVGINVSLEWIGSDSVYNMLPGRNGDIYLILYNQPGSGKKSYKVAKIEKGSGTSLYTNTKTLFTSSEKIGSPALFDNESKMLCYSDNNKVRIIDLESGSSFDPDIPAMNALSEFAILPGDIAALYVIDSDSHYGLFSLIDGHMLWEQEIPGVVVCNAAVTPDGSMGLLLGKADNETLWLISMADGSVIRKFDTGSTWSNCEYIAVSNDGSKCAIACGKSILFFSLPDLTLIGCPVDLDIMKDDSKGITVSGTDPVTGKSVSYTLPCGAAIPAGTVCTCNCVAGKVPACSCNSYTKPGCSCNSHTTTYSSHYWHPN